VVVVVETAKNVNTETRLNPQTMSKVVVWGLSNQHHWDSWMSQPEESLLKRIVTRQYVSTVKIWLE
jgi:GH35 family endo-1,4-beta-xylanase